MSVDGYKFAKKTFPMPASVQLWEFVSEQLCKKSNANRFEAFAVGRYPAAVPSSHYSGLAFLGRRPVPSSHH